MDKLKEYFTIVKDWGFSEATFTKFDAVIIWMSIIYLTFK